MACGNNHIERADVGSTINIEPDRDALYRQISEIAATSVGWRPVTKGDLYEPAASTYRSKTGKVDVYTDERGMPRLGNVYPHVHEYSTPRGDDGVTASLGRDDHSPDTILEPGTSGQDKSRLAAVEAARKVVGLAPPPAPAVVSERVQALRAALTRPDRP
ncbi:hypothetical protein [Arthrobacter sp. TE12232]